MLWAAIEDYAGLWELVWELNSIELPEGQEPASPARRVVRDSLERGWIALYRCQEPYGEMTPVAADSAVQLLDDDRNWAEPEKDTISVRVHATEAGAQASKPM